MQIQRVNRSDAEKIFINVCCVDDTTATTGYGVKFVGGATGEVASADGVNVHLMADTDFAYNFCGVAAQDIPTNGYGRVQVWGFVNSVALSYEADKTIGPASYLAAILKQGGTGFGFTSAGPATAQALSTFGYRWVAVWNTTGLNNSTGGNAYGKGFVHAM
jgi:hypothetical protein